MKKKDLLYLSLLILVWLLFFHKEIFGGYFIFLRDVKSLYLPYKMVITNLISRGEFPFWNPYINCGEPILSNPQYMLFYPTYFLLYFLKDIWFFQFHFLIHILIGTLGFYFFIKRHVNKNLYAFVGSLIYGFNGFTLSHLLFQNMVVYIGLFPFLLIAVRKFHQKKGFKEIFFISFLLVLLIFSIEPFYLLFSLSISFFYYLFLENFKISFPKEVVKGLFLIFIFAFLFASIQILPTLSLMKISPRGKSEFSNKYRLETTDLFSVLIGNYYGNYLKCEVEKVRGKKFLPFFLSFYFGAPVFFFFLYGAFSIRRRYSYLLLFSSLFFLYLSLGPRLYYYLNMIPPFSFGRYSVKFFFFIFLFISIFATLGIENFFREKNLKKSIFIIILIISILISIFYLNNYFFGFDKNSLSRINREILIQLFFILGIFFVSFFRSKREIYEFVISIILIASLFEGNKIVYSIKRDVFLKTPYYVKIFNSKEDLFRISPDFSKKYLFLCGTKRINPYFYSIEGCDDFFPSIFSMRQGLLATVGAISDKRQVYLSTILFKNEVPLPLLLNFLPHTSVKYLVSQNPIDSDELETASIKNFSKGISLFYYKFKYVKPIFHFSCNLKKIEENKNFSYLFREFDDEEFFYLPLNEYKSIKERKFFKGSFQIVEEKNNFYKLMIFSRNRSFLVFNEFHYPGWKAFLDGKEVKNFNVNGIFQGVIIPPGKHLLVFRYVPSGWREGETFFGIGVFLLIFFFFFRRRFNLS